MAHPLWLKIWLGVLSVVVFISHFPFIVMYFKIKKRPMWELPLWQENSVARFLIPVPKGGYSSETWVAIRPQPILFFLVGIVFFIFYALILCNNIWSLPLGLMVLPMVLYNCYLFDFGMDAEWHHGGMKGSLIIQEIFVSIVILVPIIYLLKQFYLIKQLIYDIADKL